MGRGTRASKAHPVKTSLSNGRFVAVPPRVSLQLGTKGCLAPAELPLSRAIDKQDKQQELFSVTLTIRKGHSGWQDLKQMNNSQVAPGATGLNFAFTSNNFQMLDCPLCFTAQRRPPGKGLLRFIQTQDPATGSRSMHSLSALSHCLPTSTKLR